MSLQSTISDWVLAAIALMSAGMAWVINNVITHGKLHTLAQAHHDEYTRRLDIIDKRLSRIEDLCQGRDR